MTIEIKEVLDMIETVSIDYADNMLVQKALNDVRVGLISKMEEINKGMEATYEADSSAR
jgi:hypothetical protein